MISISSAAAAVTFYLSFVLRECESQTGSFTYNYVWHVADIIIAAKFGVNKCFLAMKFIYRSASKAKRSRQNVESSLANDVQIIAHFSRQTALHKMLSRPESVC